MVRTGIALTVFLALTAPTMATAQDDGATQRVIRFGAAAADPDSDAANIRFSRCESDDDLHRTNSYDPVEYDNNGARIASECSSEFRQPDATEQDNSSGVETETSSECEGDRCTASVAIGNSEEARENARQALDRAMVD